MRSPLLPLLLAILATLLLILAALWATPSHAYNLEPGPVWDPYIFRHVCVYTIDARGKTVLLPGQRKSCFRRTQGSWGT